MCGIAGIFSYAAPPPALEELRRIRDHMAARGPDGLGEFRSQDGKVLLGHRRLAIIDLSERAAQPMSSPDGALCVTFNGEIYNFRELRAELTAKGRVFRSDSDTEVLLHLYDELGVELLPRLRGMFAFAIWDRKRGGMLLARDPYGVKPLYYSEGDGCLRFASQVKALLAGGAIARTPDPAGLVGFHLLGSVPEPHTLYRAVRALPAGSSLWIDAGGAQPVRTYFNLARLYERALGQAAPEEASAPELVREAVLDSVRHHLVADVPVGAFLSAGIDSGTLVGLMGEATASAARTRGLTVSFDEFAGSAQDEAPFATLTAARYGVQHHTRRVTQQELETDLPRILAAMDQPSIDGVNTWLVSKAARESGLKVAISGLGGDELFGGYPSFSQLPRWTRWLGAAARVPGLGLLTRRALSPLVARTHLSSKISSMLELGGSLEGAYLLRRGVFMPWELDELLPAELVREGLQRLALLPHIRSQLEPDPGSDFGRIATLESSLYMRNQLLRDTDWASMAHSLEVRVPLVDSVLTATLAPLLVRRRRLDGKRLLGSAPRPPLPAEIIDRAKTGFATPIADWLERSEMLGAWRSQRLLTRPDCHWARRCCYAVGQVFLS